MLLPNYVRTRFRPANLGKCRFSPARVNIVFMHEKKKKTTTKKRVSLFNSVEYIKFTIAKLKNEEMIDILIKIKEKFEKLKSN